MKELEKEIKLSAEVIEQRVVKDWCGNCEAKKVGRFYKVLIYEINGKKLEKKQEARFYLCSDCQKSYIEKEKI